jgi:hypothetical protein
MNIKKSLEKRIRGWLPKEPTLPANRTTNSSEQTPIPTGGSRLKSLENIVSFAFPTATISITAFLFSLAVHNNDFYIYYFLMWLPLFFSTTDLWRRHGLNSMFSKIFLSSSWVFSIASLILLSFSILNSIGYLAISLVSTSVFTFLYAWVERPSNKTDAAPTRSKSISKFVCTLFAVAGIVFLVFSLSLTSHVEAKLGVVNHSEALFRRGVFYLNESLPDSTVSANLTTRDTLSVIVMVGRIVGFPREYSSIDLTISQNSSAGATPVIVYKLDNITSAMPDPVLYWSVPQNGTYDITFHHNYNGTAAVEESVVKRWSASELVPTTIYTPLLGSFWDPVLAFSSILLFISIAIPIHRRFQ